MCQKNMKPKANSVRNLETMVAQIWTNSIKNSKPTDNYFDVQISRIGDPWPFVPCYVFGSKEA